MDTTCRWASDTDVTETRTASGQSQRAPHCRAQALSMQSLQDPVWQSVGLEEQRGATFFLFEQREWEREARAVAAQVGLIVVICTRCR